LNFQDRVNEYARACFTALWVQTLEPHDGLTEIAAVCSEQGWRLATWNIETGLSVSGDDNATADGGDPLTAIRSLNALATPEGTAILVLENFHRFTQSAEIVQALARQIQAGKQNRTIIVVLSPVVQIPIEVEKAFVVVEHELPNREQLEAILRGIATEPSISTKSRKHSPGLAAAAIAVWHPGCSARFSVGCTTEKVTPSSSVPRTISRSCHRSSDARSGLMACSFLIFLIAMRRMRFGRSTKRCSRSVPMIAYPLTRIGPVRRSRRVAVCRRFWRIRRAITHLGFGLMSVGQSTRDLPGQWHEA